MDGSSDTSRTEGPTLYRHVKREQWGYAVLADEQMDRRTFQFQDGRRRTFKKGFTVPTLCVGLACGLIFIEKDLGTSALIAMVAFLVMLVAGVRPIQ